MDFSNIGKHISSLSISRISQSNNRISVPVRPAQTVYTQFGHISGRPAASGQMTVPLSRIHLLNSLIKNLQRLEKNPSQNYINSTHSETLINRYATELHQVMKSIPASFSTLGASSSAGMVFKISA